VKNASRPFSILDELHGNAGLVGLLMLPPYFWWFNAAALTRLFSAVPTPLPLLLLLLRIEAAAAATCTLHT